MNRASMLLLALAVAVCVLSSATAQESEEPPAQLPSGAQFGTSFIDLSSGPVFLETSAVSLPVAVADASILARLPAGAASSVGDVDEPPDVLPAGATLMSAPVSLGVSPVSLSVAPATIGAAPTDLGGLTMQSEGQSLRFTLGADVLFDFDRADLRPGADPRLRKLVEEVRARLPRATYAVEGHTDAKGSDAYNDRLSDRRARSVQDWLRGKGGVAASAISTAGYGESRPVAPNTHPDGSDDPEGRQKNRRVEVLVTPAT